MPDDLKTRFLSCDRTQMNAEDKAALREDILAAASAGDAQAAFFAGRLYYEGFTVTQDYTEARKWFERAADLGEVWGKVYLGYCYYYGRDIPADYQKAFACFSAAAAARNHCALYKLGDMYQKGLAVKKDEAEALRCYQRALALIGPDSPEYPNILSRIGHCRLYGLGCEPDLFKAMEDLDRAREKCYRLLSQGDPYAHLPLPAINQDLKEIARRFDRQFNLSRQNVQYPKRH
ncbi:MAG: tetratricopeptide repeat protein [Pseudoramibacter sp.]